MSGFLRFVVADRDTQTGFRRGLIHAAERIQWEFSAEENAWCEEIFAWFNKELKVPPRLSRSGKPHATKVALSWFRDSAETHIARMRELAAIVEMHDMPVATLKTVRPGFVVYEDAFQVAAEPFADTPT